MLHAKRNRLNCALFAEKAQLAGKGQTSQQLDVCRLFNRVVINSLQHMGRLSSDQRTLRTRSDSLTLGNIQTASAQSSEQLCLLSKNAAQNISRTGRLFRGLTPRHMGSKSLDVFGGFLSF